MFRSSFLQQKYFIMGIHIQHVRCLSQMIKFKCLLNNQLERLKLSQKGNLQVMPLYTCCMSSFIHIHAHFNLSAFSRCQLFKNYFAVPVPLPSKCLDNQQFTGNSSPFFSLNQDPCESIFSCSKSGVWFISLGTIYILIKKRNARKCDRPKHTHFINI